MFSIDEARKLLTDAGLFYPIFEEGDDPQTLNMNDVWGWACADCEELKDEELPEVATLFWRYGWCGILYWVSKKHNGMKSEFYDVNRFIEFVKNEEDLQNAESSSSTRAYKKISYVIGEK